LTDLSKGQEPNPLNDNELNEFRNLKKKIEYLKDKLDHDDHTESEDEDGSDDEEDVQPKKKNIKAQRGAVSAEVYG
jgi:hypothetical protein